MSRQKSMFLLLYMFSGIVTVTFTVPLPFSSAERMMASANTEERSGRCPPKSSEALWLRLGPWACLLALSYAVFSVDSSVSSSQAYSEP